MHDDVCMTRHAGRLAGALTLLLVGLRWIIDSNPWSGPVVVQISATHGVHLNDWFSFAAWGGASVLAFPGWSTAPVALVPVPGLNNRRR